MVAESGGVRARLLLFLMMATTAAAQQTGGGGVPGPQGSGGATLGTNTFTGTQIAPQVVANTSMTTPLLNAPSWGTVFFADGFVNALYPGVGQATQVYSSSANVPLCQSVSYSGSYYIALAASNASTTPGTNLAVWWPVPQTGATDLADCAWYVAEAAKHVQHRNQLVILGASQYHTNGLVDYVDGSSYDDQNSVGLAGNGVSASYLLYGGSGAIPVINRPTGGGNFTPFLIHDLTIDGNATASADIELGTIGGSSIYNVSAGHVAAGTDHVIEFGHAGGDAFQVAAHDINVGIYPDATTANCGVFTANVVGGSITSYTVNTPGTCYSAASARNVYHVQVRGYQGGAAVLPCSVMPVGQVVTLSGSGIASISEGTNSGGSGCSGAIYVQVYSSTPVNYGVIFHNSDSHDEHITSYLGDLAAFYIDGGNDSFTHLHPSVVPNGINTNVSAAFMGTEIDAVFDRGFTFNQPFTTTAASVVGTNGYVGSGRLLPGSSMYYLASGAVNVRFAASSSLCDAATGLTGWQEFVTQSGPIVNPADYLTKAPAGMSVSGNDTTCSEVSGDYTPTLTVGTLNAGAVTAPGFLPQSKSAGPYSVLFDDYYSGANNASNNIGSPTGASCTVNTTYTDINHPGNLLLTAGTGGSGTGITCGYQSENPSVLSPNSSSLGWTWETAVYVPVLPGTTAGSFQGGLTNGPNVNPWTTGIEFYLSSANSVANDWYCRYSSTSTDSTVAAVAATWTRLTMVNDGTYVHWYINGTEATACKTAVGSMPSSAQYPASWSATALSATSVTMAVDYVDFQRATAR